MTRIDRQGGWVGMLVLLLALLVVAWLSKDALTKYGVVPGGQTKVVPGGAPAERATAPVGSAVERLDPAAGTPAPSSAIEKARGLEETLKRGAETRGGQN